MSLGQWGWSPNFFEVTFILVLVIGHDPSGLKTKDYLLDNLVHGPGIKYKIVSTKSLYLKNYQEFGINF